MKNKRDRLDALRSILTSREMSNQDELLAALRAEGFELTQATLSRDLKRMGVAKTASKDGTYIYMLPSLTAYRRVSTPKQIEELKSIPGFVSIIFSGNMGVIKTLPGHAGSIAYRIDNSTTPSIIGTIAGDDTIFLVMAEQAEQAEVVRDLSRIALNMEIDY